MIPGSANPLLLKSAAAAGYQIERSLRFNSSDSGYLSRTPAVAGNRRTWTWAGWVKRSLLGSSFQTIIGAGTGGSAEASIRFNSDDTIEFYAWTGGYNARLYTTQVFRDVSAWYHLVAVFDTPNAVADQRIRLYVNGIEITTFSSRTNPTQNYDGYFNNSISHTIGDAVSGASPRFFNGYLANIHFIDGQALTPSSFTEVSATTGQLIPKAYTGSFGTNGFWLKFSDNSNNTATTLGKDYSGNSNNWTPNNLSVTAGAGNDSLVDTPSSAGTDTGVGGQVTGNYAVFNPIAKPSNTTISNGNLETIDTSQPGDGIAVATIGVSSGKWYWEITAKDISGLNGATEKRGNVGILTDLGTYSLANYLGFNGSTWGYYSGSGVISTNGSGSSYGATYATNDVIGVAFNADNGSLTFYKNNVSQGTAFSGLNTSKTYFPAVSCASSGAFIVNFGQRPFAYTAPSGFKALCDTNLPAPVVAKPNTVMDVKLFSGNGSTQNITGFAFSPDFAWFKRRSSAFSHELFDVIRGGSNVLFSDLTSAEANNAALVTSFNSDGVSVGSALGANGAGVTSVMWAWDAGTSTVTNTQGSITSQVRANASAGFSIVTYQANAPNNTIGHGLGVRPEFVITKARTRNDNWLVYHSALGVDKWLHLNITAAAITTSGIWGTSGNWTSTTFGVSTNGIEGNNYGSNDFVAYCFAPVAGYSSFGVWQHNNSNDGPFIYTGFRPKLILLKNSDNAEQWFMFDSARRTYNLAAGTDTSNLRPNSSGAEGSYSNQATIDFLSNGFKIRTTTPDEIAFGTRSYIYAAWAESPFQYARAR